MYYRKKIYFPKNRIPLNFKNNELLHFKKLESDLFIEIRFWNNFFEVIARPKSKSNGYVLRIYDDLEKAINFANVIDVNYYCKHLTQLYH